MNQELFLNLVKFLDSHLVIKLVDQYMNQKEFKKILDYKFLKKEKFAALLNTRLYEQLQQQSKDFEMPSLGQKITALQEQTQIRVKELQETEGLKELLTSKDYTFQREFFAKNPEIFQTLSELSKLYYDQGMYEDSHKINILLYHKYKFGDQHKNVCINLLLGKLNTEILLCKFDDARTTFDILKQKILDQDEHKYSQEDKHLLVNYRAYLLHLAIYLKLKNGNGKSDIDDLLELSTNEKMLTTIQMICPYVSRYIAISILLSKNNQFMELKKFIKYQKTAFKYNDSWIDYLRQVNSEYDFVSSKATIKKLAQDVCSDIFIASQLIPLIDQAQYIFFENYCRLYTSVTIQNVSEFLGLPLIDSEIWIANLIRNANIEAKINSDLGQVTITRNTQNFNEKQTLKLRDLIPRTNLLANNLSKV